MTSIIDWALAEQDRRAGADRSAQTAMNLTLSTIAGSTLTSSQRLALICELEMAWEQAGLS